MTSAKAYGLQVGGTSSGEELVLCPFHQDRSPSAWWNPKKELFYCAVCGFGLSGVQLAQRLGVEVIEPLEAGEVIEEYDLVEEKSAIYLGVECYHEYFAKRNIPEDTIHHYGVRWQEANGPQAAAAVLPITWPSGKTVGAAYRYLSPKVTGTRYRIVGKTTPVWPMHFLPELEEDAVVYIVEGAWSAMHIHSVAPEIPCLALLGAKANKAIVDALRPFNPVVLYDDDMAGRRACLRLRQLAPTIPTYTVSVSPDDMDATEIEHLLERLKEL